MSVIFDNISELCSKKGITGYQLCKDVDIQPSILTDLKMGRRVGISVKNADKIAKYFGVSVDYLLNGAPDNTNAPPYLSEEERELLSEFNKLDPNLRKAALNLIKAAVKEE